MLELITHRRRRPLFLILDSLPAHKAKVVHDYVDSKNGKLKLHFLPGYAPELNPDELVWSHMNRNVTAEAPTRKTRVTARSGSKQTSLISRTIRP